MQLSDIDRFRELIAGVHDFYGKDLSDFAMSVWWEAMKPYDISAVSTAMSRHLANPDSGQFLPKPADVVKMLGGRTQDRALMAWAKVDKAVRSIGPYESVAFDDPIIHRVIHEMGGWVGFGQKTEDEWPFVGKEFENRYRGYAMRGEIPEYPRLLIGVSQAHNERNNHKVDPPRLIGNVEQAEAVLIGGRDNVSLIGNSRASDSVMKLIGNAA